MTSRPVTLADWAKEIGEISSECDDLETWGIEVGHLVELLELVSDKATRFPELLRPCDRARWEQVNYLIGLLRKAGENIEEVGGRALQKAEALSELARQESAT